MDFRHASRVLVIAALLATPGRLPAAPVLLDDFDGPVLDGATWGVATWNIGDRTQFGNQPEFGLEEEATGPTTFVRLPLDTYNPSAPGQRVLGTEIYSLENFPVGGGIEYLARARLTAWTPGLVAAFFTYNQKRQKGRWISDEIDFEVLSKQSVDNVLVTSWDDWGAPGSDYYDGVHHDGEYLDLGADGFDWREWNYYAIRWYPDRVEWYVNGIEVYALTSPVPDQDQPIRASLWAGGTTWPEAHSPDLVIASTPGANQRFAWDVDFIMVTRLDGGGGGGGGQPPAAPTGLSASVAGSQVQLAWTDNASDEAAYTVYRAWKPKGKAAPDFQPVVQLGDNATSFIDTVEDGEHLYQVTASNAAGESAPSNTVGVTVGSGGKGGGKPGRGGQSSG